MSSFPVMLRRAHAVGPRGPMGAIVGAVVASGIVAGVAGILWSAPSLTQILLVFGINAIMVVGYQTFAGNTGIVSFGHVGFMALGAYAGGIAAVPSGDKQTLYSSMPSFLSSWSVGTVGAILIGGAVAAVAALITGPALMRLTGSGASIATLALLIIINNLISQATPITHGPQAFFGVPETTGFTAVFVCLAVAVAISAAFKWSREGRNARAGRDQPAAASAAGVSIVRSRTTAFVVSAFITGVAGALYAQLLTAFSPSSFYVPQVVLIVAMAIVGGIGSVTGALAGAAVITVLNEVMRRLENGTHVLGLWVHLPSGISSAVMGVAMIVTLLFRPEGIFGHRELVIGSTTPRGRGSVAAGSEEAVDALDAEA